MDDMRQVVNRFAEVARVMVNDSAAVAQEVFGKTNPPDDPAGKPVAGSFTAADAAASMARLVDIAVQGSVALARIPLTTPVDRNVLLAADNVASVIGRGVTQATQVVTEMATDVADKGFDKDRLAHSTVRLASLAMLRGAEVLQTVAAGPGQYRDPTRSSDEITVDPDSTHDRLLELVTLARPNVSENLAHLVRFDPADRVLRMKETTFRLIANSAGIPSGVYRGTVKLTHIDDPEQHTSVEVLFAL
jgi:hypothetical protein